MPPPPQVVGSETHRAGHAGPPLVPHQFCVGQDIYVLDCFNRSQGKGQEASG
ncbi:unnamed protein product, partial [Heterosigma akashiwo]